ncbi:MAG: aminotransferase class V-fold PLP-dependent enzyme [Candidatus Dormibacteria bacterium]
MTLDWQAARAHYPLLSRCAYLNFAGVAPMSVTGQAALARLTTALANEVLTPEAIAETTERVRGLAARLYGADPEEVAFVRSTAHGLSLIAEGLPWVAGDNVVSVDCEYPANIHPWKGLERRGVELRLCTPDRGRITPGLLLDRCDQRTRLVSVSHVQFRSGYRTDLAGLATACHDRGILLCADVMQSAGALVLDLHQTGVDFMVAQSSKWLLGPLGLGILCGRAEALEQVYPVVRGVRTGGDPVSYYDYPAAPGAAARRFEESVISLLDLTVLEDALQLFLDADPRQVEERILSLAERLIDGLGAAGCTLIDPWPRTRAEMSGIVSFSVPGREADDVVEELAADGVMCRSHQQWVRMSAHFMCSEADLDRALDAVSRVALGAQPIPRP